MNTRNYQNSMLARISNGIRANADNLQRLDLERLGRRAETFWQLQDMLVDLKHQIAQKAALRANRSFGIDDRDIQTLAA